MPTTPAALPLFTGPVIVTRYLGCTDTRPARIVATHKRDSDTTWRVTVPWDHALNSDANHAAAAEALVGKWPYGEDQAPFQLVSRGHDDAAYYFTAIQPWQLAAALETLQALVG